MIGKPVAEIWRLYRILEDSGALEYSTIVVSRDDDLMTKQMLTPYTGAAVADFYKFYGMHSFVVYDDFTVHNRLCSKIYRESNGLMTYGNWSGELLERASQLNGRYGGGSQTALCLADRPQDDDELNVESETFYNYLPHLVSHVDGHIMLSDESYDKGLVPPISLFPVPYGTPKFMKQSTAATVEQQKYNEVLLRLSIGVKRILFELVELEQAARQQMELGLDLEPDVERIASNVYKLQVLFTQKEEINTEQLVLMLLCINHRMMEYVHLDKIGMAEQRIYQYFIGGNNERWNRVHDRIREQGDQFDFEHDDDSMQLIHDFLDDHADLCRPNMLSEQDLEEPRSEFY